MGRKRKAGRVARRVARKVYKKALRMPKRKLAKLYAAKCGKSKFKRVRYAGKRKYRRRR